MRTSGWSADGIEHGRACRMAGTSQRRCRKCSAFSRPAPARASRSGTPLRKVSMRSVSKPRSPRHSASSTVVTPAAAHCASCATMAEREGQRALAARLHLSLQVVRVHVDHAGDQRVALEVESRRARGPAGLDVGDDPAAQHHGAGDGIALGRNSVALVRMVSVVTVAPMRAIWRRVSASGDTPAMQHMPALDGDAARTPPQLLGEVG